MRAPSNPPRLVLGSEHAGALLSLQQQGLSPERLQRNAAAIREALKRVAATDTASQTVTRATTRSATKAASTTSGRVKIIAAIGLPAVLATGIGLHTAVNTDSDAPTTAVPAVSAPAAIEEPKPATASSPPSPPSEDETRQQRDSVVGSPSVRQAAPQAQATSSRPRRPVLEGGRLAEQIALYEAAQAATQRGDATEALAKLDLLASRFPTTPLRAEVQVSRLEALMHPSSGADRETEAIRLVQTMLKEPEHAGRLGELWRVQGDLWRRAKRCDRAVQAYREALRLKLSDDNHTAVQTGLRRCQQP